MCSGVGKSGSPALKLMTSSPAARISAARVDMAIVADSAIEARRSDIRPMVDLSLFGRSLSG